MNARLLLRLVFLLVICGYAGSFAFADNIIPWLNGGFDLVGYESEGEGTLGFGLYSPSPIGVGAVSFIASLSNVKWTKTCFDDQCLYGYIDGTGSVNSGTITIQVNSIFGTYNFSGLIHSPGWFELWQDFSPNCYDICETEQIMISFKGMWTSGWVSTGNLVVGSANFGGTMGSMSMTTLATPEPCTLALLTTAGIYGTMRWRMGNRRRMLAGSA